MRRTLHRADQVVVDHGAPCIDEREGLIVHEPSSHHLAHERRVDRIAQWSLHRLSKVRRQVFNVAHAGIARGVSRISHARGLQPGTRDGIRMRDGHPGSGGP
mgnify:CR=1 FL=1